MAILLLPVGSDGQAYTDSNGAPRVGAQFFVYLANTATKATIYADAAGTAEHSNPILTNSSGQIANTAGVAKPIFATSGVAYDIVLAPSNDTDPPVSPYFTLEDVETVGDPDTTVSEWTTGPEPTYVSTTSFTVTGDQTETLNVGRRVKLTDSTTLYGTIITSAYTSLTTVTVVLDSGSLSVSLSDLAYAFISGTNSSLPSTRKTFTPTVTLVGGAGNTVPVYSTNSGRAFKIGTSCEIDVQLDGDGGAEGAGTGQVTIALPFTASASIPATKELFVAGVASITTVGTVLVLGEISASGTTVSLYYQSAIGTMNTIMDGDDQSTTSRWIHLKFRYHTA